MSKRTIGCIGIGIGVYVILGAILVAVATLHHEDFNSSPTTHRDVYGFADGRLGILKEFSKKVEQVRPADKEMAVPERWNGKGGNFVLEWENKKTLEPGTAPDPWVESLAEGEQVEFVAYGLWIPQPEDPIDDDDWRPRPLFRTADAKQSLTLSEIEALGIPEELTHLPAPMEYQTPRLSLLLRTRGIDHVRFTQVQAGDARTEAKVSYDLESLDEQPRSTTVGEWTRLDLALLLWHDTSLTIQASILTGKPIVSQMKTALGQQLVFNDQLRIQWIGGIKDDPSVDNYLGSFKPAKSVPPEKVQELESRDPYSSDFPTSDIYYFHTDNEPDPTPSLLIRASSDTYLNNHLGLMTDDGIEWEWDYDEEEEDMYFASLNVPAPKDKATFLFIPHITTLKFAIPALPDMPNPRDSEDLFDITIPRLTVPPGSTYSAERQLLGYIGVASQIAWDSDTIWDDHPPKSLPHNNTFINESPQSLLNWYLDNTPTSHADYNEDELLIKINEDEDSWWYSFVNFFNSLSIF